MNPLKKLRQKQGLTQKDLATISGVSIRTIQRIEGGEIVPKGYTLRRISEILNYAPSEFQKLYQEPEKRLELDYEKLKWMNLAGLLFFLIPFSNIFVTIALRSRFKKDNTLLMEANKIVNFHCSWGILFVFSLSISPFLDPGIFNYPLILVVLFAMVLSLVVFILVSTQRIHNRRPIPSLGFKWM